MEDIPRATAGVTILTRGCYSSHQIDIDEGLLRRLAPVLSSLDSTRALIVTDENVWRLYGNRVMNSLRSSDLKFQSVSLPPGEKSKTLETLQSLYDTCVDFGVDGVSMIVGLGGGVVGDIAGFLAATWMRGIAFVNIPTTLVAITNASIGGKVAVNHPKAKNLVGAFKDPMRVLIDLDTLNTLPSDELRAGMAEVVATSIVSSPHLFCYLETERNLKWPVIVEQAIRAKLSIVEQDPFDKGIRAWLNLGHTFGHALEVVSGFAIRHGDAIGIGLEISSRIAGSLDLCSSETVQRISAVLQKLAIPRYHGFQPQDIWNVMTRDKKQREGQAILILPRRIGEVATVPLSEVGKALIMQVLEQTSVQ